MTLTLDLFIHPFPLIFFSPVVWNFPFYTSCLTCLSYSTDIFTNVPLLLPEYRSSTCLLKCTEHFTGSHRGFRGGQRDATKGQGRRSLKPPCSLRKGLPDPPTLHPLPSPQRPVLKGLQPTGVSSPRGCFCLTTCPGACYTAPVKAQPFN